MTPQPGWVRSSGPSALPGTKRSADVVLVEPVSKTRLVATLVPATSSTLLPDELLRELTRPPEDPVEVRLGGQLSAYYSRDLSLPRVRGRLDVYAAPTTERVATVACLGPPSPLEECADTANTLQLGQGEPIRADPGTAFRLELFPVMDEVDAAREQTRRLLQRATTPKEQAAAAAAVRVAYGNAARRLEPLAVSSFAEQRAVVAQLRTNATAYARLSGDLKAQDEAALVRDREVALKGETRLKARLSEQQG